MASSSSDPEDDKFPIEEIVFSCSVCQATVSDVYAIVESNHGFHSGSGHEDGIVTKMWIGECSHITCARHLANGAAPFHPKDKPPRAPCPKCVKDHGDDSLKDLFRVHGLSKGAYDPVIPDVWLQCPAVKLDTTKPGMEAVRFQYMALGHYARQVRKHWKNSLQKQFMMETAYSKERKARRQVQSELPELKTRIETLEKCEAQLKKWETRKPEINHYMHAFGQLAKDNESMRQQLVRLGYDISKREYTFKPEQDSRPYQQQYKQQLQKGQHNVRAVSRASAANAMEAESSSSARKRKRDEYADNGFERSRLQQQEHRGSSRHLMPPPLPKPKLPQRGLPPYAEPLSGRAAWPAPASRQCVEVYEDRTWREAPAETFVPRHDVRRDATYTNSRPQEQKNLPIRPSPTRHDLSQDFLQHRTLESSRSRRDDATRQSAAQSVYDAQSFAQLSLQSPKVSRYEYSGLARGQESVEYGYHTLQNDGSRPLMYHSPTYRDIEKQQGDEGRPQHRPFAESKQHYYGTAALGARDSHPSSVPQEAFDAPAASVTSPFFKQGSAAYRPPTMQRPAMRGTFDTGTGFQLASSNSRASQAFGGPKSLNGLPFIEKPRRPHDRRALYQSTTYRQDTLNESQEPLAAPQTPRNSQGLFQRPDRPPPPASYATSRPQLNTYRDRVTIPPTTGPQMPMAANQDEALSQIRGVRGVSSQASFQNFQRAAPSYGAPRPLFSSAGGRRSVRR